MPNAAWLPALVLASFADVDAAMADGEWLSIDAAHVREVEP